jgi:hypothetical protein
MGLGPGLSLVANVNQPQDEDYWLTCINWCTEWVHVDSSTELKTTELRLYWGYIVKMIDIMCQYNFLKNQSRLVYKKKLHGLSPRVNYTDRATAACRRSDCQLVWIEGATWSEWRVPMAVFSVF